jgi:hypothetical protein
MTTETIALPRVETPLAQTFARVREVNAYLQVHLGTPEDREHWPLASLCDPASPALAEHLAIMAREYTTGHPEVLVRFYFNGVAYTLASAAVGAFMVDRRVPNLDLASLSLTVGSWGGPDSLILGDTRFHCLADDPAADHADAIPVANHDALRDHLREGLIAAYAPVIATLRQRGRVGARALWIAAAETCAGVLVDALPQDTSELAAQTEVRALISQAGSTLRAKPEVIALRAGEKRGLVALGNDCCCNFRIAGETYCNSCPHRPRAERIAALQAWIAER